MKAGAFGAGALTAGGFGAGAFGLTAGAFGAGAFTDGLVLAFDDADGLTGVVVDGFDVDGLGVFVAFGGVVRAPDQPVVGTVPPRVGTPP